MKRSLLIIPHGADVYATTRTTNNTSCLLLWERHLERLAQSIRLKSETVPDMFPQNQIKTPQFDKYLKSIIEPSMSKGLQRAFEIRTAMDEFTVTTLITGLATDLATNTHNDVRSLSKIDFLNDELGLYHYYVVFGLRVVKGLLNP